MVHASLEERNFSLTEVSGLVAQMMHDLISPFSAISAGIEMTPQPGDEIWQLITRSKCQLTGLLEVFRDLFGSSKLSFVETEILLKHILTDRFSFSMSSNALIEVYPRIALGLCFWLVRQAISKRGSIVVNNTSEYVEFVLSGTNILPSSKQDTVLMRGETATSGAEFYAYFLYQLLQEAILQVKIVRSVQNITVRLEAWE